MLQTEDLFLGALAVVRGGELRGVLVQGVNGRRMAIFRIDGDGLDQLEREYHRGPAMVDLRLLKSEVARLKNLAFAALREEERKDAGQQGGDRGHQGGQRPPRSRR